MTIRIVDYGVGNIQAFVNMFQRLDVHVARAQAPGDLADATGLILPGVGAFDHAMTLFNRSGMRERLEERVLGEKVPVLGVCVGMQMLAQGSDEGALPGLNWIPGRVRALSQDSRSAHLPMPHMGWNDVCHTRGPLFEGFEAGARFYFLHSFYFECEDSGHVSATAEYGFPFACAVSDGNVHGIQCHPEKSHRFGAQLLKNFARL